MTIVEQIHSEIEDSINEIERLFSRGDVSEVMPIQFSEPDFMGLVGEYKFHYPQNTFITEQQVKNICLKYGLVCGSALAFDETIPDKNKKEIGAFQLKIQHELGKVKIDSAPKYVSEIQDWLFRYIISNPLGTAINLRYFNGWRDSENELEATISMRILERGKKYFVLLNEFCGLVIESRQRKNECYPTSSHFPFCQSDYTTEIIATVFMEFEVDGVPHLFSIPYDFRHIVNSLDISHRTEMLMADWAMSERALPVFVRQEKIMDVSINFDATLGLLTQMYCKLSDMGGIGFQSQKVIAPLEKFNQNTFKIEDGYRLRLDYKNWLDSSVRLDDPIVLQPVKGGYLVVTKWGSESNISEIQNGETN